MKIHAIKCSKCGCIIFSRAIHDFRSCLCGYISIDGGFDYTKISCEDISKIEYVDINLNVTKKELYDDWNMSYDKFGRIIDKDVNANKKRPASKTKKQQQGKKTNNTRSKQKTG